METRSQDVIPTQLNQSSKRTYTDLADYAAQQGAPLSAFAGAGWRLVTYKNRPALEYPTTTGNRWRYLDGGEKRHDSPFGYKGCWYGLDRARIIAGGHKPLVMVNGAAGVIVAQHFGIPAFAVSDGESRKLTETMLDELKSIWSGEIIVALDCDQTGQTSAAKRARQLLDAGFIARAANLHLGKNGDIADFCKVHGAGAFDHLLTLPEIAPAAPKKAYKPREGSTPLLNTDEYAKRVAAKWLENNLAELAQTASGRRDVLLTVATKIGGLVKGGYVSESEAERGLMNAAANCGLIDKYGEREVTRTIADCFRAATAAIIDPPPDPPAKGKKPPKPNRESTPLAEVATLAPFTADRTFNSRYVNQAPDGLLDALCIALKSPTGSGKSKWAAETTADAPTLLTVAFRTAIVKSQSAAYGTMNYDDLSGIDGAHIQSVDRVSSTIDSLPIVASTPHGIRTFDTIVIDEEVSAIRHISSAGTLKEKAASTWELLKQLITSARRVIVMDAHLTDDALAELKALRGDLVCIENAFVQPKAPTQILPSRQAFFSKALERVKVATAPVLLGVTSPAEARLTKDLIKHFYPDKRVRVVTVKQSHLKETQVFIRRINSRLPDLDVLIFNGAMSTGVDIQADVDSIVCLIDRPLSPADGVQMLGRARKAQNRFARVPDTVDGLDHDPAELYEELEFNAHLSGIEVPKRVKSLGRLHARYEARRNLEIADYLAYFRAYCHADGSQTQPTTVRFDKVLADLIKAIREGHTEQKKRDVLDSARVPTITPEMLEAIREEGEQEITPEIDAGYLRHKIESATGQPVSECLFDKYRTSKARATLRRVDISSSDHTAEFDRRESDQEIPLHQRTNASAIKKLRYEGLKVLGAKDIDDLPTILNELTAEAFAGFGEWASKNAKRFKTLLGYRSAHNADLANGVKAARFFLAAFGINLERKQVMRAGERFQAYRVDAQAIADLLTVLASRRAKAAADREQPITTNRQYKPLSRIVVMPKPPSAPPITYPDTMSAARRVSISNPFSALVGTPA